MECPRCHGIGFLNWSTGEYETACEVCNGTGQIPDIKMTPIFEIMLEPKDPKASITKLVVRVDDPANITSTEEAVDFVEKQFPFYTPTHVIAGFKQVIDVN